MRPPAPMPRHRPRLTIAALFITLLLSACGSQAGLFENVGNDLSGGGDGAIPQASGPGAEQPAEGEGGGGPAAPDGNAAPIEQRIIKTGEVGLEVDNVAVVLARVRALAVELGGYVGASQAGTMDQSATVTLRVPAARFDELLARLHELTDVEVVAESTREQDVTREIIDLEARIRNLQASETSYRVLLDRAEQIEDILTVQSRLDQVRGSIEQLEGQLQAVEGQADLSTLTVTIIPRDEPVEAVQQDWDPGAQAKQAAATLVGLGQGVFDALIWILIVVLPIVVVLGLIMAVAIRVLPEMRRRLPAPQPASGGDPPAA